MNVIKLISRGLLTVLTFGLLASAPRAQAGNINGLTISYSFSLWTNQLPSAGSASNFTGTPISLSRWSSWPGGLPVVITSSLTPTNNGSSNYTLGFDVLYDNTNWTSQQPLSVTHALNGSNNAVGFADTFILTNATAIRWDFGSTTQTNNVPLNALTLTIGTGR